jgi:hypothetical protein
MSGASRWRGRRSLAVAVALSMAAGPAAVASTSGRASQPRLVAPGSWGPVDFGDQVEYRLRGGECTDDGVRVTVTGGGRPAVRGAVSRPVRDLLHVGTCVGVVAVPSERAVRRSGWDAGDPIAITVVSGHDRVPLRYERIELESGRSAAGAPQVVTPDVRDPRGGQRDRAVQMTTGDVMALGQVDLSHIHSVSLRVCTLLPKPHVTPTFVELRAGSPDGPSIVGPVDVNDDLVNAYKANYGWPNCWQLQPWPVTGKVPGRAPELFLAVTAAGGGPVLISYVDVNGTGAKVAYPAVDDPRGTRQIFAGRSWKGWDHDNCVLDEGAARPSHSRDPANYAAIVSAGFVGEAGCSMTYTRRKLHDVSIRLDYRMQDFGDNGAVYVGGHEIQLREAGEWLTGGFLGSSLPTALTEFATAEDGGGYPAQRIKSNTYPDWSRMEVVQIGSRFIVRINGRTVTDCRCAPDPGKFTLRLETQPGFSYQYGAGGRFDSTFYPDVEDPADWGNVSFRNIRVYDCASARDPVCVAGPGVRG